GGNYIDNVVYDNGDDILPTPTATPTPTPTPTATPTPSGLGTFVASAVTYDHNTKTISFHGTSMSEDVGNKIHVIEITTCNTLSCEDQSNIAWCDDDSTILTDPLTYTCAINSSIYGYNFNPNIGDTVYLVIQTGAIFNEDNLFSQAIVLSPTSTPTPTPTSTPTPTPTNTPSPTPTPIQLTTLAPAKVWVGLQSSNSNGIKYDLKA